MLDEVSSRLGIFPQYISTDFNISILDQTIKEIKGFVTFKVRNINVSLSGIVYVVKLGHHAQFKSKAVHLIKYCYKFRSSK